MPTRDRSRSTDLYTSFLPGISAVLGAKSTSWDAVRREQFFSIFRRGKKSRKKRQIQIIQEARFRGESRYQGYRDKDGSLSEAKKKISASSAIGLAGETRSRVARPRQVRSNKKEEIVAPKGVLHRLFSGYLFISRRSFEPSSLTNGVICVVHVKRERSLRLIYESRGSA